jgi:hypothetical protein
MKIIMLFITTTVLVGYLSTTTATQQQQPATKIATAEDFEKIGPQGLVYVPDSVEGVIRVAPAAVIADIIDFGPVLLREAYASGGIKIGHHAFTTYKLRIREVLYNRSSSAPPVKTGDELLFTKMVGQAEAKAFASGKTTVSKGDECLLFLWHQRGAAEWSIVDWPFQFRRSKEIDADAVAIRPDAERWLAGTVVQRPVEGTVVVDWTSLVERVKRAARVPTPVKRD